MAGVYKRGDVWWVRFRRDGVHVRRSAKTNRKAEAQAFLERLLAEHAGKARGDLPRHRFSEAVERYFQETRIKPTTLRSYRSNGRTLAPTFDGTICATPSQAGTSSGAATCIACRAFSGIRASK